MKNLKKGNIVLIQSPSDSTGTEIIKTRPAIVVSPTEMAQFAKRIIVVPLTTNITKIYPFEALITSSPKPSKACCDQIQTVSMQRVLQKYGALSKDELEALNKALRIILNV